MGSTDGSPARPPGQNEERAMRLACFTAAFLIGFGHAAIAGPTGSSESIAACDRAAASPFDKSRPAGLAGVPTEKIDFVVAIAACEEVETAIPAVQAALQVFTDEANPQLHRQALERLGHAWLGKRR